MLMHIVCFKYKADTDAPTRAQHRSRLAALQSLDGVVDLKVGEDVVRSARSYDTALVMIIMMRSTKIQTSSFTCVAACGTASMMKVISATPVTP